MLGWGEQGLGYGGIRGRNGGVKGLRHLVPWGSEGLKGWHGPSARNGVGVSGSRGWFRGGDGCDICRRRIGWVGESVGV
jgi:hypothetical protein